MLQLAEFRAELFKVLSVEFFIVLGLALKFVVNMILKFLDLEVTLVPLTFHMLL